LELPDGIDHRKAFCMSEFRPALPGLNGLSPAVEFKMFDPARRRIKSWKCGFFGHAGQHSDNHQKLQDFGFCFTTGVF
jgi:hypothetical protein